MQLVCCLQLGSWFIIPIFRIPNLISGSMSFSAAHSWNWLWMCSHILCYDDAQDFPKFPWCWWPSSMGRCQICRFAVSFDGKVCPGWGNILRHVRHSILHSASLKFINCYTESQVSISVAGRLTQFDKSHGFRQTPSYVLDCHCCTVCSVRPAFRRDYTTVSLRYTTMCYVISIFPDLSFLL